MSSSLMLSCSCGSMSWSLASAAPRRHVVCYCADCRSFPTALGHPEFLDENGGLHILQTVPGHVTITHGHQHLAALKLSPKGMVRYHSGCCGTPIANVLEKKTLPFVGLAIPAPAEQCGPVRSRVNVDSTRGKVKELNPAAAFFTVFGRAIGQNQAIQHPIARAYGELQAAELMVRQAAALFDAGQECGEAANLAKLLASEAAWKAADTCMQTHGGFSFARDFQIERKWRECRLFQIAPISSNMILNFVAQNVLGLPRSY